MHESWQTYLGGPPENPEEFLWERREGGREGNERRSEFHM
jgi:hypothetical protein